MVFFFTVWKPWARKLTRDLFLEKISWSLLKKKSFVLKCSDISPNLLKIVKGQLVHQVQPPLISSWTIFSSHDHLCIYQITCSHELGIIQPQVDGRTDLEQEGTLSLSL